jgi:hypothetical protein
VPRWKRGAKEFTVSVNHNETRGYQSSIPKPIIEALGEPDGLTFVVKGKRVEVHAADKSERPSKE